MKSNKKNPLSYLGWLGLIGVLGICMGGATWMLPFLLFFFFFTYRNMVADELFWNQVRRAGLNAFWVNLGYCTLIFSFLCIRATFVYKFRADDLILDQAGNYLVPGDFMGHMMLFQFFMIISWIVNLCTFFFSLMHYRRQEKKFVEDEACLGQE